MTSITRCRRQANSRPDVSPRSARNNRRGRPTKSRIYRRRRILAVLGLALAAFTVWLAFSLGGALTNPALGSSFSSRFSEWARNHGGASIVNWVEKEWYSHHQPPVGGKPPAGAIRVPHGSTATSPSGPAHLPPPNGNPVHCATGNYLAKGSGRPPVASLEAFRRSMRRRSGPTPYIPATWLGWPGWTPSC